MLQNITFLFIQFFSKNKFYDGILNLKSKELRYKPPKPIIQYVSMFHESDLMFELFDDLVEHYYPEMPKPKLVQQPADLFTQAMQYFYGTTVPQNYKKCMELLDLAESEKKTKVRALAFKGWMYLNGKGNVRKDFQKVQPPPPPMELCVSSFLIPLGEI